MQESDGGTTANNFNGSGGNDVINAEGGDDTLEGGEGNDELNGGAGEDVAIYNSNEDDYQITPNIDVEGVAQLVIKYVGSDPTKDDEGEDILSDIEIVRFSDGTQKTVQTFIDESNSTEGDSSEIDSTETTTEDLPSDLPVEDQPSDSPVDEVVPQTKPVKPAPKPTTSTGSANDKIAVPIEISMTDVKYGTKDADTITIKSSYGENWLNGLSGNDTIKSGSSNSTLLGGAGNDSLTGSNTGDDCLIGGSGIDHLVGGIQNGYTNTFIFGTGDTGIDAAHDVIEDFNVGYDKIDLAGATVVGSVGFGVELTLLDSKTSDMESFTEINQVRRWVDFENNQTLVQINLDKDFSTVEAEISLTGLLSLTEENFILTK